MKEKKLSIIYRLLKCILVHCYCIEMTISQTLPSLINNAYIMLFGQLITSSTNLFDTVEDTYHMS